MVPGSGTGAAVLTSPVPKVAERRSPQYSPRITFENDSGLGPPTLLPVKLTLVRVKASG